MRFIRRLSKLSFEQRLVYLAPISITFSSIICIGKFLFAYFFGFIFFVSGVSNVFMFVTQILCYIGMASPRIKSKFKSLNFLISLFIILSGATFFAYSTRLIVGAQITMKYPMWVAIIAGFVSFLEFVFTVRGLFELKRRGYYFRNLKITNFCHALTSISLASVSVMSMIPFGNTRMRINGVIGMICGIIILILGAYIFIAPRISIIDREHNVFKLVNPEKNKLNIKNDSLYINLKVSKIHGDFYYVADITDDVVDGYIFRARNFWRDSSLFIKIISILFIYISLILYCISGFIYFLKTVNMPGKLQSLMEENGYKLISQNSE